MRNGHSKAEVSEMFGLGANTLKAWENSERNERKREEFVSEIEALPENSELYYIDESGFDEYYLREYGYAPRGEKVIEKVNGRHFARTSVAAVKNGSETVTPSSAFSGSMDGGLFESWLEHVFAPSFKNPF